MRLPQPSPESYYQESPMTHRTGDQIAHWLRIKSVERLADRLPEGARVANVGAGWSTLGQEVCELRSDVDWVNVDIQYTESGLYARDLRKAEESKPPNLSFVQADALTLVDTFGVQQFDRVDSYWMIQYLILAGKQGKTHNGKEAGIAAVENMLRIAKLSGEVAIGPAFRSLWNIGHAKAVKPAEGDEALERQARKIVHSTALPFPLSSFFKTLHKVLSTEESENQ